MLKFDVKNQTIYRTDRFQPVEKSINYLYARFAFLSDDWTGAEKRVICENKKTGYRYDAPIQEDGRCLIPWEALTNTGSFKVCVEGRAGRVKFSTEAISVDLGCTMDGGAESNPPSLTEFEQLKKDVAELKENGAGSISPEDIQKAVGDYLEENPPSAAPITINGEGPDESGNFIINTISDAEIARLAAALT